MVATDVQLVEYSGRLRSHDGHRYIDPETPDAATVFEGFTSTLGSISGSVEAGRAAAYLALEVDRESEFNIDFHRDHADLHILFVSDADDNSGDVPIGLPEFIEWARSLKDDPSRVVMHALTGVPGHVECASGRVGLDYLTYAEATGGIVRGICEPDWAPSLAAFGLQTTGHNSEYFLSELPVLDPFTVRVRAERPVEEGSEQVVQLEFDTCMAGDDESRDCQVVYEPGRNSVTFLDYVVEPTTEVLVDYTRREESVSNAVGRER